MAIACPANSSVAGFTGLDYWTTASDPSDSLPECARPTAQFFGARVRPLLNSANCTRQCRHRLWHASSGRDDPSRLRSLPLTAKRCRELGLTHFGKLSVDGTKVRANANKRKAMSYGRMRKEERRLAGEIAALVLRARETDDARGCPRRAPVISIVSTNNTIGTDPKSLRGNTPWAPRSAPLKFKLRKTQRSVPDRLTTSVRLPRTKPQLTIDSLLQICSSLTSRDGVPRIAMTAIR